MQLIFAAFVGIHVEEQHVDDDICALFRHLDRITLLRSGDTRILSGIIHNDTDIVAVLVSHSTHAAEEH